MIRRWLTHLFRRGVWLALARLERQHAYDATYLRELFDLSPAAFRQFARVMGVSAFREDLPLAAWHAARFAATRHEDCGACAELMLSMASQAGISRSTLHALIDEHPDGMDADAALGWRFARAVLERSADADNLRREVMAAYGPRALASLALAIVAARSYPTLKYALGHGHACTRLTPP